jgi:hypothetical protein
MVRLFSAEHFVLGGMDAVCLFLAIFFGYAAIPAETLHCFFDSAHRQLCSPWFCLQAHPGFYRSNQPHGFWPIVARAH